ncbi:MAG: metal-sulfur cluster assembly factor [Alphaproteobacteria bacterium]|nr:metal-sulfur cluster assembly factor [Alphaproteobacteria bacterium]
MSEKTENKENIEEQTIGATESRLLQAMSINDEEDAAPTELPEYIAYAGTELAQGVEKAKMFDIVEKIRTISDPEIPLNVYDMGLIYKIDQRDNGDIYIEMTVTAPTCPIAGELPQQVADALTEVAGTGRIEVKIVWEPAWTPERMTDEAKEMLELI